MTKEIENEIVFSIVELYTHRNCHVTYVGVLYWLRHSQYYAIVTLKDTKTIYNRCLKVLPNSINNPFII